MTVFVCVDDRGGMTFNSRRQSRDERLIDDVLRHTGDSPLYVTDFSEELFENTDACIISVPSPLDTSVTGAFVFIENLALLPHVDKIKTLVIYRWNRAYPYDTALDIDPLKHGFKAPRVTEFEGKSHKIITKEVYER